MSSERPDLDYIKRSGVGKVMAQALGSMYKQEPKFPIEYLVQWLRNYMGKKEYKVMLEQSEKIKEDGHLAHLKHTETMRIERERLAEIERQKQEALIKLKADIQQIEHHSEKIESIIPPEIFSRVDLTSVYIGSFNFKKLVLDENDDNEIGHLNFDEPKAIRFTSGAGTRLVAKRNPGQSGRPVLAREQRSLLPTLRGSGSSSRRSRRGRPARRHSR